MEMNIRGNWDRLSRSTQQWLTDNPGCLILPRTMTETIGAEIGISVEVDQHGETTLSQEDLDFIRAKVEPSRTTPQEYRFFDATGP